MFQVRYLYKLPQQHGRGESYHGGNSFSCVPDAVAFIESTDEVVDIVKVCQREKIPMIPYGAGSSLEGHLTAIQNGTVCLNLTGLDDILQVDAPDMTCRVQAGATRQSIDSYIRDTGLFFPVDPGAAATIGGMVSTNASGTTTLHYGSMKHNVMGLTVVLPDGRVIRTGSKTRKSSAGYDLTRLFIGAEGTLGIVTEIQLRLHAIPQSIRTGVVAFSSIHTAIEACVNMMQMGIPVARMEFMDSNTIQATNAFSKLSHDVAPTVLIELHGSDQEVKDQSEMVQEIIAQEVDWAMDPHHRKQVWAARHNVWYATLHTRPDSVGLVTGLSLAADGGNGSNL